MTELLPPVIAELRADLTNFEAAFTRAGDLVSRFATVVARAQTRVPALTSSLDDLDVMLRILDERLTLATDHFVALNGAMAATRADATKTAAALGKASVVPGAGAGVGPASAVDLQALNAANMAEADAQLRAYQERMAALPMQARESANALAASWAQVTGSYREVQVQALRLAEAQKALADVQARTGVTADEVAVAQRRVVAAQDAVASATTRAALAYERYGAAQRTALAGGAAKAAESKGGGLSSVAGGVGTALLGGAVAVAGAGFVGYEAAKAAAAFQAAMMSLHTQAGVSMQDMKGLSKGVLDLAGQVGYNPTSLAAGLFHIESSFASTGISGKQAMALLQTASQGAKIGNADLVDVTNALDAAVVAGIPGVQNLNSAMGALNATVGAGDMHMQDLANAFGTGVLARAKIFGLSIKDVGAALALFGDNNIRGAKAGTQLAMVIQSLAQPGAGPAATKALAQLGMTSSTLAKDMQSGGLNKAVTDLHDRLIKAGVSGKETGAILQDLFTKKAGAGIAILIDQYGRLQSKYTDITKGANAFGAAWQALQGNFTQSWDKVTASFDAAKIKLGQELLPIMTVFANWLADKGIPGITRFAGAVKDDLVTAWQKVQPYVEAFGNFLSGTLWPLLEKAANVLLPAVRFGLQQVQDGIAALQSSGVPWVELLKAAGIALGIIAAVIAGAVVAAFVGLAMQFRIATALVKPLWDAFVTLNQVFLAVMGSIIHGAAEAFGWLPGLGPKLKAADAAFQQFAASVNNELAGIHDRTVYVNAVALVNGQRTSLSVNALSANVRESRSTLTGKASGGPIQPGQPYWVGENGPELIVPQTAGYVIPTSQATAARGGVGGLGGLGGGAPTVLENHIHVTLDGQPLFTALQRQTLRYERHNGHNGLSTH